ncbi:hypothetical protein FRB94_009274 [Tulasnella sp. JGI-2019a]|nr:hypothetical protein FRB94_009274 [Tulasnella sp. JGI-2019a]KAG9000133.1 hypothetical protein FRB93_012808 [Tulasnella sp. JGI-2019a]KAG9026486.1 hypothetical protein FRB95_008825 [Tulasnella sp. JGI-2019a]
MLRHLGMEDKQGEGGGIVSKESTESLKKAEALLARNEIVEALPHLKRALRDENNLDADIIKAMRYSRGATEALQTLDEAVKRGRRLLKEQLGANCFDDDSGICGKSWGILQTRPFMRVLQVIVRTSFESSEYELCTKTIIEMLRLCWTWTSQNAANGKTPIGGGIRFFSLSPLSPKPIAPDHVKILSRWADDCMMYNGALAAFRLYGDCELARQYLRLGVERNPHICVKILGRVKKPSSLDPSVFRMMSYSHRENARDYLFLTSDLWMEAKV